WEASWACTEPRIPCVGDQAEDKIGSLVNKMMMDSHVNVVGEGLVGRSAFTGNHMWVLPENYAKEMHPLEVQNEVCQQFLSGIKTIAVIPVINHGVVQLGSSLAMMENMAFVTDVRSLILQLGCIPGVLLSENYTSKDSASVSGSSVCLGKSVSAGVSGSYKVKESVPFVAESCNQLGISSQDLELVDQPSHSLIGHTENSLQGNLMLRTAKLVPNLIKSENGLSQPNATPMMKALLSFSSHLDNGETGGAVIPSNPRLWLNQQASLCSQNSGLDEQLIVSSSSVNCSNLILMEKKILSDVHQEHVNSTCSSSGIVTSQLRVNGESLSSTSQVHDRAGNHVRSISNLCSAPTVHIPSNFDVSCIRPSMNDLNASKTDMSVSYSMDHLTSSLSECSSLRHHHKNIKCSQIDVPQRKERKERIENNLFQAVNIPSAQLDSQYHDYGKNFPKFQSDKYKEEFVRPPSGDDLFDILGVDLKNKLLNANQNNPFNDGSDISNKKLGKNDGTSLDLQDADSDFNLLNGGDMNSGIFSSTGTDHLLDAIVNSVQFAANQSSDDYSESCGTTLTKISSSFDINASSSCGPVSVSVSDKMQGQLFELPKSLAKLGVEGSCSFKSECSKEDTGKCSQTSSIYGSHVSSWIEQGHSTKNNSSSTAYSKRPDEVGKSNRKRLKPGENPRPRPKDRQMIQDRMKELREIVPNGAKCSIDALLERTIKHMLFLQSVTKHADKLKQTGDSKIISKDGGLVLKDNYEGGRTWAYEVGSQSMVCPIIVEDLNPPRQMLVEMLCEERGLFLEIADIIRGLGLTILKGVMETRNDKIWARFAVETSWIF
ncbi:unnamed protein product, partial [Thlaspi arvense]